MKTILQRKVVLRISVADGNWKFGIENAFYQAFKAYLEYCVAKTEARPSG